MFLLDREACYGTTLLFFLYYFQHSNHWSAPLCSGLMRSSDPSTSNIEPNLYIDWPIIIPKWPVDYLMDAIHYEKIADQLMQFRGKIPKNETLRDHQARMLCDETKIKIDAMLMLIDEFAKLDDAGWIR